MLDQVCKLTIGGVGITLDSSLEAKKPLDVAS